VLVQDGHLHAFVGVDHVPESKPEQPRYVLGALLDGNQGRCPERESPLAEAHAAGAGRIDVLEPVRLTSDVQSDTHGVANAEGAHWCVAHKAGPAPNVLQIGERGMAGKAKRHPVDGTARSSGQRSWKVHGRLLVGSPSSTGAHQVS
jgi:hypothetical protein